MSNGGTPDSHLLPGDLAYHDDKQLIANLTALNGQNPPQANHITT